mgnify:CR=1 FL=1
MSTAALPWSSNVIYTADVDFVISDGCLYLAKTSATSGSLPPTHTYGTASDGGVSWKFCMREVAVVRLSAPVAVDDLVAVYVDIAAAEADVRTAIAVIDEADLGDEDAELAVGDAQDHDLAWYATQELPFLLDLL